MAGKIKKLEKIMKEICNKLGIQECVDITLGQNPARIYFTFENRGGGSYLNTSGTEMKEVFEIAEKYGLRKDKSYPKYKPGNRFALGFKLNYDRDKLNRGGMQNGTNWNSNSWKN